MREFYRQREPQLLMIPVDMNPLLQQVVDLTRARWSDMAHQRGIAIEMRTELAQDLPAIMGADNEILEALINLIFNTVDAMPNGGPLTLRTSVALENGLHREEGPVRRFVQVEVIDAGIGMDSVLADCGIHALHLACFITGQRVQSLSADFVSAVPGRQLEDDALLAFRMSGGAAGRLWTSAIAAGRMHGLTIQVFGEKGGFRWHQEQPNQLHWTPVGGATSIVERGVAGLSPEADRASRVTVGHAEGFFGAFGNIYADIAEHLRAKRARRAPSPLALSYPTAENGLHSIAAVQAAVASAGAHGAWVNVVERQV